MNFVSFVSEAKQKKTTDFKPFPKTDFSHPLFCLHDIEEALEVLGDQVPLLLGDLVTVEFLQCVDGSSADV